MRAVLKGKTQEFIQGGITPSGLATQVRRGIIKGFDAATYRATVQLLGSLSVWLDGVPVAKHLGSNLLSNGVRCGVLFFDESNPDDACVAFVYDGAPGAWITSGLVVDGTMAAADCLSNVAGGVATIDAAGDLNPPNHVRAAGRFYPGGQGTRYLYDAGATSGLAVAGGHLSTVGRVYPGTGSALQTAGYLAADATGRLALMGGKVGIGTTGPETFLHLKEPEPRIRIEQNAGTEGGLEWYESSTAKAFLTYRGDAAEMKFYVGGGASGNIKMVIEDSGEVGIGETDPARLLHIKGSASRPPAWRLTTGGGGTSKDLDVSGDESNRRFDFQVREGGGSWLAPLTIKTDTGDVGIGATPTLGKLHVAGIIHAESYIRSKQAAGNSPGATAFWLMEDPTGNRIWSTRLDTSDRFHLDKYNGTSWTTALTAEMSGNVGIGTTNPSSFKLQVAGDIGNSGYLYPGTGAAVQSSRYLKDDGSCLVSYGGLVLDIGSGNTPLAFQRGGSQRWLNYVYWANDYLWWASYYSGGWHDKMGLNPSSGDLSIDGSYYTFSPVPPKGDMSPEEYLAWAMEDASKPPKPYADIPRDPAELERYRKDISKIAIGVARYVDHLRVSVAELDLRLARAGL